MPTAHTATLTITGASLWTQIAGTTYLNVSPGSSQLAFPAAGEAETTITLSGLPNYVLWGDLEFNFTLIANGPGGSSLSGGDATMLYQTEAAPTGIQAPVWRNVLDDACAWAMGYAGADPCRYRITRSLHNSLIFEYDPYSVYYTVPAQLADDGPSQYYKLKQLFADRGESFWVNGDCRDVSNYLCIALMALGVSAAPKHHQVPAFEVEFQTHAACGIGFDNEDPANYHPYDFLFHQTASSNGLIYDAAAAHLLDLSGNLYMDAPNGWPVGAYWQTSYPTPPGISDFLGLVWRYSGSQNPEGQTVPRITFPVYLLGYAQ